MAAAPVKKVDPHVDLTKSNVKWLSARNEEIYDAVRECVVKEDKVVRRHVTQWDEWSVHTSGVLPAGGLLTYTAINSRITVFITWTSPANVYHPTAKKYVDFPPGTYRVTLSWAVFAKYMSPEF